METGEIMFDGEVLYWGPVNIDMKNIKHEILDFDFASAQASPASDSGIEKDDVAMQESHCSAFIDNKDLKSNAIQNSKSRKDSRNKCHFCSREFAARGG